MKKSDLLKRKNELTNYLTEKHPELRKESLKKFADEFVEKIFKLEKELTDFLDKEFGVSNTP